MAQIVAPSNAVIKEAFMIQSSLENSQPLPRSWLTPFSERRRNRGVVVFAQHVPVFAGQGHRWKVRT